MTLFLAGLVLFFITHLYSAFRSRAPGQDIKARLGEGRFMGLYTLIALPSFILLVWGYVRAPAGNALFVTPLELRWVSIVCLLLASVLIMSTYLPAGRIKRTVKHPMVTAVGLWGLAHLLYGGDALPVVLFGSFLLYAALAWIAYLRRPSPVFEGAPSVLGDVLSIGLGTGLFFAFVYGLHAWLLGIVPVLPF